MKEYCICGELAAYCAIYHKHDVSFASSAAAFHHAANFKIEEFNHEEDISAPVSILHGLQEETPNNFTASESTH